MSEPESPAETGRPSRKTGVFVTAAVLVAVVALAAGFAVGRATDDGGKTAVSTASPPATSAPKVATPDTVPTLAFGEAVEKQPDKPLDNATRDALAADLVAARASVLQYPTVASARAAGLVQAGEFAPGAGAHFMDYKNLDDINADGRVIPTKPASYIYDGINPTSRLVGIMYVSLADGDAPAGFPGPNDHWHLHQNLCIKYGSTGITVPFAPDRDVTREQCATVHGQFMRKTVWMVHAWVVPGWESPEGVFSHANTNLRCADGSMHTDEVGFCRGT